MVLTDHVIKVLRVPYLENASAHSRIWRRFMTSYISLGYCGSKLAVHNGTNFSTVIALCNACSAYRNIPYKYNYNLMASQTYPMSQSSSEENIKSDATAQTDITFPKNLPESVQKILNTYSICSEQKSKTKLRSTGEEVDNSDNPECVQQQNYDYDLPSPPYSDFDCQLVEPQDYVPEDPNMYAIEHEANSNNEI
ncbi:uncharacterized protein LOC106715946 isoform X1 [Papilio machaon]|uniref:uncharacterized protein LOC106715946 isoform X1 n=1 Tax=Papilio machaon TaxID=76193 RepID=UPI001E662AAA|nr:uncharacterized protein LOC106715946 isoform X1 [Papilio machaon]